MNTLNDARLRVMAICFLIFCSFTFQKIHAQCTTNNTPDCAAGDPYYQVVLSEFGGDAGQSDSVNDAIVELSGPANTDISGMVVTNTEWAVVLPAGSILRDPDGDGIGHYVLICEENPTLSSFTTSGSGLSCADCDFPGLDVDINPTGNQVNGFNVCDKTEWGVHVSSSITTYSFTLDNGACGASLDGDQVILFQPDGTVQDAAYYGGPDATASNGGAVTVGGSSGNCGSPADHVAVQIAGISYTLGDNDDNGIVNDYTGTHVGFKGDGGNATGVNLMPSQDPDGDGVFSDEVCYTVPSLSDPIWTYVGFAPTSCNSTYIRMSGTDGSQGQGNGAQNPSHNNDPDLDADFGPETADTPSSCPSRTLWGYTDHPTPGFSNDVDVWDFYLFEGGFTEANLIEANELTMRTGITEIYCNPGPVTFAVRVYNYQQVEPTVTTAAKAGSFLNDGTTDNMWVLHQTGHSTATTAAGAAIPSNDDGTTTMYFTVNVTAGVQDFTLVWDDYTNCCGSGSTSTVVGRAGTNNQNECYEDAKVQITVGEPITVSDNAITCPGDFDAGIGTIDFSTFVTSPASTITYELREGVTAGMEGTTGTIAATNLTGVFNLTNTLTPPFAVILRDNAACGADVVITIEPNCAEPPVCPEITGSTTDDADGNICPGQTVCFDITAFMDLPDGGTIDFFFDTNPNFNPYAGEGTYLDPASPNSTTPNGGAIAVTGGFIPSGGPVINEVLYDPTTNDGAGGEYIEIAGTPGLDVSCYILTDGDDEIVIPNGTVIPADGFLVLAGASTVDGNAADVDVDLDNCNCFSDPGDLEFTNSTEFIYMYDAAGNYVDGLFYGTSSTTSTNDPNVNNTEAVGAGLYTGAGCPAGPTSVTTSGHNAAPNVGDIAGDGESIVRDPDVTGGFIDNSNTALGMNSMGATNGTAVAMTTVQQFCYTFDNTFCNLTPTGDFTIKAAINPFTSFNQGGVNCQTTDPERFETFTLNMTCPTADLTANTIDQCVGDGAINVEITVANGPADLVINDGTGGTITPAGNPYATGTHVVQIFDGNTPTAGEISVTLASVTATAGAMCNGTVDVDEVLISINPNPTATVSTHTDFTGCGMGQEGTVTFTFTGNGPFDFTYSTPSGNVDVAGAASTFTITAFEPGNYDIVSIIDGNSCEGTVTSNVQNVLPPANYPVTTAQNFAACTGNTVDLSTAILFDIDETGDGGLEFDDENATTVGAIDFYNVNPSGQPPAVLNNLQLTGADLMVNPSQTQTYFYTYLNAGTGCMTVGSFEISINEIPEAMATATQPVCPNGTMGSVTIDLINNANANVTDFEYAIVAGGTFAGTPTFTTISTDPVTVNAGTGTAADADGETYTIRVRNRVSPSCLVDLNYTLTAVNCGSCPIIGALSDPADICEGQTFNITASGLDDMAAAQNTDMDFGIAFQIFTGNTPPADPYVGGINLGAVTFANLTGTDPNQMADLMNVGSALTPAMYQICAILTPTPTDAACRPTQCITFMVNAPDDAGFTYPSTACQSAANPIPTSIIEPGGTFSVNNGATINMTTGELDLGTTTANTTYTITYLTNGNCPASSTQMITINAAGNASFTYPANACMNAATNPTATVTGDAGGTFSVDNGATINATTGELDLTTTTVATTYTITYAIGGACPASSTQMITIQRPDDADFTYPNMVCQNAATNPTATITGTTGGTFSVDNGATINATTGELDLTTTTGGTTYTIAYSVNGTCPNSETQMITVQTADDASFDYPNMVCINAVTNPSASNIATAGGTFSIDNGATIDATTGELDLSTTTAGTTYTISYLTNGNCPNTAIQTIVIQAVDDASFDFVNTVCINATNPSATNIATTGGTFSIDNGATIDATTGELDLSTTTAGTTYTITYLTNSDCPNTATQMVTVQAADDAGFTYLSTVCQNAATNPSATITGDAGGIFSVDNGATINATTGELDLNTTTGGTTYTVTYTTAGACPNSSSQMIAVQTADDASFDYPTAACMNAATNPTASNIATAGGTFSVDNGATIDATTGELDLSTTTQNTTYTITYNTNSACPNSSTQMITIGMTDDANFDYPMAACMNAATNPTASNIATAGGTFSVNNGATIDATTGELDLTTTTAGTTYTVTYSTTGTCANNASQNILIDPVPNATLALAGQMNICNGNSTTLNFFAGGGTADYTITYEINDGTTTTTATVTVDASGMASVDVFPTQNTTYTLISVENNEGCTATATGSVSINILPNPTANPATITECEDSGNGVDFDLNTIINTVNDGATGVSVTFHTTLTEAEMDMAALPLIYNVVPNATIFARVEDDATGCFSTSEITLNGTPCSIQITDPCSCLDNATNADDGQFTDNVIVTAPAGQTWYIATVTGLFDPMIDYPNPIPSGAQYPLTAFQTGAGGELLVEEASGTPGISNYYLQGVHVDALGYSITVTNGTNNLSVPNGTISDTRCYYPDLFLTVDNALACSNGSPFSISFGENSGASGVGNLFLNNAPYNNTTIDPTTLNAGTYTLRYDFDAGAATQGNAADPGCLQSIETTFEISEANEILCRPPVNTVADAGLCGAVVQLLPPVILDENVAVANVSSDAPAQFPIGTTEVTWTVTDANGCSQTCNQFVTINDQTPPTIDCGNAFYAGTSWVNCGYPSSLLEAPTVSDECGILSVTNDAPAFFEPGMYMPTWTVTDVNGNTASCMQWVTITDTTNPKFTSCPSEMTVSATTGTGANVTWPLPQAMDNCAGDLVFVSTHDSGDFFPLGTTMVIYTVYDQGGNSEECSFFVNVVPVSQLVGNNAPNTVASFELLQNKPNPFSDKTTVVFNLPKDDAVTLTIYDLSGRILKEYSGQFVKGRNEMVVERADISGSGVLFYELKTPTDAATGKMVVE